VIVIRKSKDEEEKKIALFGCLEERMAPPMGCSSSHGAGSGVAEAQESAKPQKVRTAKWLGKDIRNVVRALYLKYPDLTMIDAVADRMEFDTDVLDLRMKHMVLG
jgi:hypothetical protein